MYNTHDMNTKRILVVDDDEIMLEGLKIALEEEHHEVVTTNDNSDILKRVTSMKPDLILIDYRMPGDDGAKITQTLKRDQRTKDIPVIMFSASKGAEEIAHQYGADSFLEKPFELDELIKRVHSFLS